MNTEENEYSSYNTFSRFLFHLSVLLVSSFNGVIGWNAGFLAGKADILGSSAGIAG